MYLYSSVIYNTISYPETRFLAYIRAVEGILRILLEEETQKHVDQDKIESLCAEIKKIPSFKVLPPAFRRKLKNTLLIANAPSLEERLRTLIQHFSINFCNNYLFQGNTYTYATFATEIAAIRNFLSHQLPNVPPSYENKDTFHCHIDRLEVMLQLLLFKILGFEYSEVEHMIQRKITLEPYAPKPSSAGAPLHSSG